jgi:hypothetical protein
MLSKTKYPMLNRQQRRHPKRFIAQTIGKGWNAGGSWLLAGLMIRGGFTPRVNAEGAQV